MKMSSIQSQISHKDGFFSQHSSSSWSFTTTQNFKISHKDGFFSQRSSSSWSFTNTQNFNFLLRDATTPKSPSSGKMSPAVLFIIIILAVVFFISGFLHLLIRILRKQRPPSSIFGSNRYNPDDVLGHDALQRQLQQLFSLHDVGLDQAFIDTLPVFHYKEIVGLKEPFDCAVCLCEFCEQDRLRLLPLCSHAFHVECIDTWLKSNSSCPVCRAVLHTPGIGIDNPVFDFEDSREGESGFEIGSDKRVFPVRLGKFKSTSNEVQDVVVGSKEIVKEEIGETSSSCLDARRCHSMGSYQYVVTDSILQVALCPNRALVNASSESGKSGQNGKLTTSIEDAEARKITAVGKNESLSVSKIWLWSKKSKFQHSSNADLSHLV